MHKEKTYSWQEYDVIAIEETITKGSRGFDLLDPPQIWCENNTLMVVCDTIVTQDGGTDFFTGGINFIDLVNEYKNVHLLQYDDYEKEKDKNIAIETLKKAIDIIKSA